MDQVNEVRLLVCGDRDWEDKELIRFFIEMFNPTVIIEGECDYGGADIIARDLGDDMGLEVLPFPAQWGKYRKAAGPIRNSQMLREGKPTIVIGFHDNIEKSKGTKDMLKKAVKAKLHTILVSHKETVTLYQEGLSSTAE